MPGQLDGRHAGHWWFAANRDCFMEDKQLIRQTKTPPNFWEEGKRRKRKYRRRYSAREAAQGRAEEAGFGAPRPTKLGRVGAAARDHGRKKSLMEKIASYIPLQGRSRERREGGKLLATLESGGGGGGRGGIG